MPAGYRTRRDRYWTLRIRQRILELVANSGNRQVKMKVFVTGGSGYLGQPVIRALRQQGHEVTALVRSQAGAAAVSRLGAAAVRGGLGDLGTLRDAGAAADGVI